MLIVARGGMYVFLQDRVPLSKFKIRPTPNVPSYSSSGNLSFEESESKSFDSDDEKDSLVKIAN